MEHKLDLKALRESVEALCSRRVRPIEVGRFDGDWHLSIGGVACGPGGTFMHPAAYKDIFGEEKYQALLARPRIVASYDLPDENE